MDQLNLFPEKVEGASDEASNAFLSEIATNNEIEEDQIEATAQASGPEPGPDHGPRGRGGRRCGRHRQHR